jgi:2-methylaconitate cis-trans-isomerase PrpF
VITSADYGISARTISSGQVHRAIPVTGALCTAVGQKLAGNSVAELTPNTGTAIRIGSPSGAFATDADVDDTDKARSASLYRTCRRLMQGSVPHR